MKKSFQVKAFARIPIKIEAPVKRRFFTFNDWNPMCKAWLIIGGRHHRMFGKMAPPRKMLMVRSPNGVVHYFYWTEPNKGQEIPRVRCYLKGPRISFEQVEKRYKNEIRKDQHPRH